MLSKNRRQLIERLKTRKGRPREGLVLVEGVRASAEVLAAGADIRFVIRSPRLLDTEAGRTLASTLAGRGPKTEEVDDADLAALSDTEHPQGVLCVCTEPGLDLAQLRTSSATSPVTSPAASPPTSPATSSPTGPPTSSPTGPPTSSPTGPPTSSPTGAPATVLLLDALQDPGNLGTLIRAARAFGVDAVIVLDGSVDPWNPKAVRAAAGASFHVQIARAPWTEAGRWLEEKGIEVLAADPAGDDVRSLQVGGSWALAVGNEGAGLRAEIVAASTKRVAIPMPGEVESLNAGVAGSILLYSLLTRGSVSL